MINNENRIKLIEEIQKIGKSWEALAESSALSAVRKPKDKDAQENAQRYVLIHDTTKDVVDKIIPLVNAFWPKAQSTEDLNV